MGWGPAQGTLAHVAGGLAGDLWLDHSVVCNPQELHINPSRALGTQETVTGLAGHLLIGKPGGQDSDQQVRPQQCMLKTEAKITDLSKTSQINICSLKEEKLCLVKCPKYRD